MPCPVLYFPILEAPGTICPAGPSTPGLIAGHKLPVSSLLIALRSTITRIDLHGVCVTAGWRCCGVADWLAECIRMGMKKFALKSWAPSLSQVSRKLQFFRIP